MSYYSDQLLAQQHAQALYNYQACLSGMKAPAVKGNLTAIGALTPTRRTGFMKGIIDDIRGYLNAHRDIIMTLAVVFLADHFLLKGALRERLQKAVESFLAKAEKKLTGDN